MMPETLIVSDPFPVSQSSGQSRKLLQQSLASKAPNTTAMRLVAAPTYMAARVVMLFAGAIARVYEPCGVLVGAARG